VSPDPPEHDDVIGDDDRHEERDEQAQREAQQRVHRVRVGQGQPGCGRDDEEDVEHPNAFQARPAAAARQLSAGQQETQRRGRHDDVSPAAGHGERASSARLDSREQEIEPDEARRVNRDEPAKIERREPAAKRGRATTAASNSTVSPPSTSCGVVAATSS